MDWPGIGVSIPPNLQFGQELQRTREGSGKWLIFAGFHGLGWAWFCLKTWGDFTRQNGDSTRQQKGIEAANRDLARTFPSLNMKR